MQGLYTNDIIDSIYIAAEGVLVTKQEAAREADKSEKKQGN